MSFIRDWMTKKRFDRLYEAEEVRLHLSVSGKDWLCPYCLQVPVGDEFAALGDEEKKLRVYAHVMECPRAAKMEGEILPLLELRDVVEFRQLLARYAVTPSLRVFGADGRWVCPYCRQATEVSAAEPDGQKLSRDRLVRAIQKHLRGCYKYDEDPANIASVDEIRALFQSAAKRDKFSTFAEDIVRKNPVFRFKDAAGHWVCPFCEASIRYVDMSTELLERVSAPKLAARHFAQDGCKGYDANLKTLHTPASMQKLVEKLNASLPKITPRTRRKKEVEDEAYLRDLRAEVMALREELKVSDELEHSLIRAREVQEKMLPDAVPEVPGYEFGAFYRACANIGGDFYDFIDLDGGRTGIVMGDVSGHGLEAALVMGMTKKAFSLRAKEVDSPAEIMRRVNADVYGDIPEGMFITAFYGIIDPAAEEVVLSRAGHNLPLLYDSSTGQVEAIRSAGMMLGGDSGKIFNRVTVEVKRPMLPGSLLLEYTDGATEAMNGQLEEFGMGRLSEVLARNLSLSAQEGVAAIVRAVESFSAGRPQEDDICLVAVKRL